MNKSNDFQKIVAILEKIKTTVSEETDTLRAGFDNHLQLLDKINNDISQIRLQNYSILEKVDLDFAPTSLYQELSIANGWSDLYNKLSKEFDIIYKMLIGISKPRIFKNKLKLF